MLLTLSLLVHWRSRFGIGVPLVRILRGLSRPLSSTRSLRRRVRRVININRRLDRCAWSQDTVNLSSQSGAKSPVLVSVWRLQNARPSDPPRILVALKSLCILAIERIGCQTGARNATGFKVVFVNEVECAGSLTW